MFSVDGKQDHDQDTLHMNGTLQNGLDEKAYGYKLFMLPSAFLVNFAYICIH